MRRLGAVAALLLAAASARAGDPGTAAGTFLTVPVGGRALGMGGAYTALAADAYAPFYNPGALGHARAHEVVFQQNEYILDLDQQYLAYVHPFRRGAIAIAWTRLDHGLFDRTLIASATTFSRIGTFDASSNAIAFGYGWRLGGGLSVGVQGKWIREEIAEFDASAGAVDLGLHWRVPGERFDVGLTVQNLGSDLKFVSRDARLPRLVRLGIGYTSPSRRLLVGLDVEGAADEDAVVRLGGEYWVTDFLAIRAGLDSTSDEGRNYTVGVGFRRRGLSIDYAYSDEDLLDQTHRVSVGYRWAEHDEAAAKGRRDQRPSQEEAEAAAEAPPASPPALRGIETLRPTILLVDLREEGGGTALSAALADELERLGYAVRRVGAIRPGDEEGAEFVVSGTVSRGGFSSVLVKDASNGLEGFAIHGGMRADPEGFGEAAAGVIDGYIRAARR